jgi:hypothetical protein
LFISIDSSISGIVIKGETSIYNDDVSFFSCAKIISLSSEPDRHLKLLPHNFQE